MDEILSRLRGDDGSPIPENVRKAAALLGPGYRGERLELDEAERASAAAEVVALWGEAELGTPPAFLKDTNPEWSDRRAKLFEIGDYDDKSLSVSPSDLQRLAAGFEFPVPILVEHTESPARLGYLTHVEAAGAELFGVLALTPEADTLIEETGAKSLSLSVDRDLARIYEVSIVANPRVAGARLFCSDFTPVGPSSNWKARAESLKRELEAQRIAVFTDSLVREGVLAPAAKESAERLLAAANEKGIQEEVAGFLRAMPKQVTFGELVPTGLKPNDASAEEAEFYRRHFPDLSVDEILKRKVNT